MATFFTTTQRSANISLVAPGARRNANASILEGENHEYQGLGDWVKTNELEWWAKECSAREMEIQRLTRFVVHLGACPKCEREATMSDGKCVKCGYKVE